MFDCWLIVMKGEMLTVIIVEGGGCGGGAETEIEYEGGGVTLREIDSI